MGTSFYFYDLETSGISPRNDRIMQFAGQRTDTDLKPIGEPDNYLIKLTADVLPQPDAILTHGISPQKANAEGIGEPEFLRKFLRDIVKPGMVFVGFNNIRFDDEFMRFTFWRNFFDAYEWQWKDSCSRWDLLDMARMCRALRPEGIEWPFAPDGKPTVALEPLAAINKLTHDSAHDALSDVKASIAVARLIKSKQPKLFEYLFELRNKTKAEVLVNSDAPIIYTSGRYPADYLKTTVATMVGPTSNQPGALMYDLRIDPTPFLKLSADKLAELWTARGPEREYFPVKVLRYNRAPAISTIGALDALSLKRLKINLKDVEANNPLVMANKDFAERLNKALEIIRPPHQPMLVSDISTVDDQLYDGFINGPDKTKMSVVRAATAETIKDIELDFDDVRLGPLFQLYKARNFTRQLTQSEVKLWQSFREQRLNGGQPSRLEVFWNRLDELKNTSSISAEKRAILQDLADYGQSLLAA
jgi:exodeoxyribonuclease-1